MFTGVYDLPWWGYVVYTLVMTHITIAAVTIYLHRHQAHRALDLHPLVSHFFRFWLWLTTGMVTKEWTAIHRKHHAKCETVEDPHSPQIHGIRKVLLEGAELYRAESRNRETLERYGHGTPDDWIERNVYGRFTVLGISLLFILNFVLFGFIGITIWAVQMMWIPFLAAGVINGIGHYWGYRNFQPADASRNIVPWGILIGGEELHNNHHAYVDLRAAFEPLVRVRHRLALHPHAADARPRAGEEGRADPEGRHSQEPLRPCDVAGGSHSPLRSARAIRESLCAGPAWLRCVP